MPALVYNQPLIPNMDKLVQKQVPAVNELPLARGGIKPTQLPPPKPLLMKQMP